MKSRLTSITLFCLLLGGGLAISGCVGAGNYEAQPVDADVLPPYTIQVETRSGPDYDEDGYDLSLGFNLTAADEFAYNAIVQEIVQQEVFLRYDDREITNTLTLVEAFQLQRVGTDRDGNVRYRLPPMQRDRHFVHGYLSVGPMIKQIDVHRVVRYYPAFVEGADWTRLGFAHLPGNRGESITTNIPDNFNENHQDRFIEQGQIVQDDRANGGWYSLHYHWWREPSGRRPQATLRFREDERAPSEPIWITQTFAKAND
ncbi:hypothetical protein OAU50_01815 [Planctomycetota bacterium]|nr:hypothetical protein [Planctomycetota bacterium]